VQVRRVAQPPVTGLAAGVILQAQW